MSEVINDEEFFFFFFLYFYYAFAIGFKLFYLLIENRTYCCNII